MKAMVLNAPRSIDREPLQLSEMTDPRPGAGQVCLKVSACGVCHTDLHIIEGELPPRKLPLIPGHQIVGRVDKLGQDVAKLKPGDRVGVAWLNHSCGQCSFCRQGKENLCTNASFTGYDVDGGYAQYTVAPASFVYPLPESPSDLEIAPLLCAGIIGFRAFRLSGVKPGQNLGLYGFGASAHLTIQVAVHQGCQVYVFTRSPEHRALAEKLGAVWTGRAEDVPPGKLHSAIIFAPAGSIVPYALQALERGGVLALAGIYMSQTPPLDYIRHLYHEKTIRSVANATRQDALDFLRLAAEIPVRTEIQTFELKEANKALLLLKQGKIQGAGVLQIP
jgi:propanol-preferring alcohol dehydrogenase